MVLSCDPDANRRLSGLQATQETLCRSRGRPNNLLVCPRDASALPLAASQTMTVPSFDPDATRRPSGLQATLVTSSVCPGSANKACPFATVHSRTVWSWDPDANWLP